MTFMDEMPDDTDMIAIAIMSHGGPRRDTFETSDGLSLDIYNDVLG